MPGSRVLGGSFSTPNDLPSIWGWWEPSLDSGSNGVGLQTLTDQTGNARNWTQATAGSRPLYDTSNALNGHAVVTFNTDRFWDGPDLSVLGTGTGSGKESHLFIVLKADADPGATATDTGLWKLSTASDGVVLPFTDSNWYDAGMKSSRETLGNPAASLASWRVYEIAMLPSSGPGITDGSWKVRLDGTEIFSGNIVAAGPHSAPTLGRNSLGWGFKGKMAGFYIGSSFLNVGSADRNNMIGYINGKFATSAT